MKIGVISDTHLTSCDSRLTCLLRDYFLDVDLILHAGDLVDISVLDAFIGKDVKAVFGNMDPIAVRKVLPDRLILNIDNYKIGLIHGWGMPFGIEKRLLNEIGRVDCLIYGHTHKAANEVKNGVFFFNPGSATDKRFASCNTIGILEIGEKIKGTIIKLKES